MYDSHWDHHAVKSEPQSTCKSNLGKSSCLNTKGIFGSEGSVELDGSGLGGRKMAETQYYDLTVTFCGASNWHQGTS